jgi:hypothetical protein
MLTNIDEWSIHHFSFGMWKWLLPVLLLLFVSLVVLAKSLSKNEAKTLGNESSILFPNYIILLAMVVLCGGTQSASDSYIYELKTERLILEGRYDKALKVGQRSLVNSPRLSNLRMYALSMTDSLPEHLFDYPQWYGADGLVVLADTDTLAHRLTARDITAALGAPCGKSIIRPERYFQLLLERNVVLLDSLQNIDSTYFAGKDSLLRVHQERLEALRQSVRRVTNYHLCSFLLRRDAIGFLEAYDKYFGFLYEVSGEKEGLEEQTGSSSAEMDQEQVIQPYPVQRAYREALAVVSPERVDSVTYQQRAAYVEMRDSIANPTERANLTRRKFGNTFWWYLDNL